MRDVVSIVFFIMLFSRLFSLVLSDKSWFRNARWFQKATRSSEPDISLYFAAVIHTKMITDVLHSKTSAQLTTEAVYGISACLVDASAFLLRIRAPQHEHSTGCVLVEPGNYSVSKLLPAVIFV